MYNIENKKALNLYKLPYTVGAVQMLIGIPIFFFSLDVKSSRKTRYIL